MKEYKEEFIKFLVKSNALKFGEFELKSGRISPYFINTGMFSDGDSISKLSSFYAKSIHDNYKLDFDVIYGPAYKGIPLCISTAIELSNQGINREYCFNRKEKKEYGDKGSLIGATLNETKKVVLIDDVITAGTAMRETIDTLKENGNPIIKGITISVNRKERGKGQYSAIQELEQTLGIKVSAIIDFDDITSYLHNKEIDGNVYINDSVHSKMIEYKKEYGV